MTAVTIIIEAGDTDDDVIRINQFIESDPNVDVEYDEEDDTATLTIGGTPDQCTQAIQNLHRLTKRACHALHTERTGYPTS